MKFGTVLGDPHKVADFINSLIASKNEILIVEKTQNHSTYLVGMLGGYLLQEDGSYLLLEDGFRIVL
jgi:hypothetical protein